MITLISLLAAPALPCGGTFCDTSGPVVQNAERIVFAVDREVERIETHVQISYEGPSNEFAWVVPVPNEPELFISTQTLFDSLARLTIPTFQLSTVVEGECSFDDADNIALLSGSTVAESAPSSASQGSRGGVQVVARENVGPFATETLLATSDAALLEYLQTHGYDVPNELGPVLEPYVADGAYFVALRLQSDKDVGDLAPLGMRYNGDEPMIPIQLTSVAAADDLRLEVYVFGDERAVPASYLHVHINEAAIDWWNFQDPGYNDVITLAADEAGGHAFATDFAGDPSFMQGAILRNPNADLTVLTDITDILAWVSQVRELGVPASDELVALVADHLDIDDDVAGNIVASPWYYDSPDQDGVDFAMLNMEFAEFVWQPLVEAEALLADFAYLSRMTSSLDAVEMTVDPLFVFNADMTSKTIDVVRNADFVFECSNGEDMADALRRLELQDGRVIVLPSARWLADNELTEAEYLAENGFGAANAQIIEETARSGDPSNIEDRTPDLTDQAVAHNARVRAAFMDDSVAAEGCGCASGGFAPVGSLAVGSLLGLLGWARRRA